MPRMRPAQDNTPIHLYCGDCVVSPFMVRQARPEHVEGRMVNYDTVSWVGGNILWLKSGNRDASQ